MFETTFGNVKADVPDHFEPDFQRKNFVDVIKNSDWPEYDWARTLVRGPSQPSRGPLAMTSLSEARPPSFSSAQNSKPLTLVTSRYLAASSSESN